MSNLAQRGTLRICYQEEAFNNARKKGQPGFMFTGILGLLIPKPGEMPSVQPLYP